MPMKKNGTYLVDVVAVLTESPNSRKYWGVLKTRLKNEGSQLATNCGQLRMESADGKYCDTDVADTEQLFGLYNLYRRQRQSLLNCCW